MLLRPRFSGNVGVTLADSSDKDNLEIILYEAYILGRLHAESVNASAYLSDLNNMKKNDWENDVDGLVVLFKAKYESLKK